jgi:hypothetical protein
MKVGRLENGSGKAAAFGHFDLYDTPVVNGQFDGAIPHPRHSLSHCIKRARALRKAGAGSLAAIVSVRIHGRLLWRQEYLY